MHFARKRKERLRRNLLIFARPPEGSLNFPVLVDEMVYPHMPICQLGGPMKLKECCLSRALGQIRLYQPSIFSQNMEDANPPEPYSKRSKLSVHDNNHIVRIPDSLLTQIFSYLPFKDRYLLCHVSSKWAATSRIPWSDVICLTLNTLPQLMVNPILSLCPKIAKIEAKDRIIRLEQESDDLLVHENVRVMKLCSVRFVINAPSGSVAQGDLKEQVRKLFGQYLTRFPGLTELLLLNVSGLALTRDDKSSRFVPGERFSLPLLMPAAMVASLRRLVVLNSPYGYGITINASLMGMPNLECLYLEGVYYGGGVYTAWDLPKLRELCVLNRDGYTDGLSDLAAEVAAGKFPKLEVFMYSARNQIHSESLALLFAANLPLRVLVIAGRNWHSLYRPPVPETLQPSWRFPRNAGLGHSQSRRTPPLQIFVGGEITKDLRFPLPPSDFARFWRIDSPMPEYLAKPAVAEALKGVWTAEVLREGPANGVLPWGHPHEMHFFYSTSPLLFC